MNGNFSKKQKIFAFPEPSAYLMCFHDKYLDLLMPAAGRQNAKFSDLMHFSAVNRHLLVLLLNKTDIA